MVVVVGTHTCSYAIIIPALRSHQRSWTGACTNQTSARRDCVVIADARAPQPKPTPDAVAEPRANAANKLGCYVASAPTSRLSSLSTLQPPPLPTPRPTAIAVLQPTAAVHVAADPGA